MKTLVTKNEITADPKLAIVKAFRIANKRAGECKRLAMDEAQTEEVREDAVRQFEEWCGKLRDLASKADENGFKIWVNLNGKTGHTYTKDYKPTADSDNNFEAYQAMINQQRSMIENLIFPAGAFPSPSCN